MKKYIYDTATNLHLIVFLEKCTFQESIKVFKNISNKKLEYLYTDAVDFKYQFEKAFTKISNEYSKRLDIEFIEYESEQFEALEKENVAKKGVSDV